MIYSFRFYISWIIAAIFMYVAFYFWHGVFLNDFNRISFSKALFLALAAIVYLIISLLMYKIYESKLIAKNISHPIFRGLICGFLLGFILFAIVTVLGISFTKNINLTYIFADCVWQIAEQSIGGLLIGLVKLMVYEPFSDVINSD